MPNPELRPIIVEEEWGIECKPSTTGFLSELASLHIRLLCVHCCFQILDLQNYEVV